MPADSDTASLLTLTESLRPNLYRYKGDRRFQATAAPKDYASLLELMLASLFEKVYDNRVYYEPTPGALAAALGVRSPDGGPRCLDLGSGMTAAWCIAMASQFPAVECIGIDLVPADLSYLPPNLTIEVGDLLEGLPYPDEFFDLVHVRVPGAGLPAFMENPDLDFLAECARVLRPGGIFLLEDVHELQYPFFSDSSESNQYLLRAFARMAPRWAAIAESHPQDVGRPAWGARMANEVRRTGAFDTVLEKQFKLPLGLREGEPGPREEQFGWLNREAWLTSWICQSAGMGLSEEEIREEHQKDLKGLPEHDVGLYVKWNVVWAVRSSSSMDIDATG